jgi:O-antigen/teichoic acid export membrane protein
MAPYYLYRRNARRVFPALELRWRHVRWDRLREVTGFSAYLAVIKWSSRVNYAFDSFIIGIFLNTTAVGVYSVALRLSEALYRMTHQLQVFLFPAMVHRAVQGRLDDQRRLMVQATRFQVAIALALCASTAAVADALVREWVGPAVAESARIAQILIAVVALRAWMAVPGTLLQGTGRHAYVAKVSSVTAVANVLLSVALVPAMGLVGVALGTLIPVAIAAVAALFPAACAEVKLPVIEGYRRIVWPALWPALVVVAALAATRQLVPARLLAVLAHMGLGAAAYAAIFVAWGLDREERGWLAARLSELWRRRSQVLAAA